jgi:hypothetical protein
MTQWTKGKTLLPCGCGLDSNRFLGSTDLTERGLSGFYHHTACPVAPGQRMTAEERDELRSEPFDKRTREGRSARVEEAEYAGFEDSRKGFEL